MLCWAFDFLLLLCSCHVRSVSLLQHTCARQNRAYVVGVAGATGSGKSTLSRYVASTLQPYVRDSKGLIEIVHGDDFYKPTTTASLTSQLVSQKELEEREDPMNINWSCLAKHIATLKSKSKVPLIIVESFVLGSELALTHLHFLVDVFVFLHAPLEICMNRRLSRSERQEQELQRFKHVYRKIVWPAYQQHNQHILSKVDSKESPIWMNIDTSRFPVHVITAVDHMSSSEKTLQALSHELISLVVKQLESKHVE